MTVALVAMPGCSGVNRGAHIRSALFTVEETKRVLDAHNRLRSEAGV